MSVYLILTLLLLVVVLGAVVRAFWIDTHSSLWDTRPEKLVAVALAAYGGMGVVAIAGGYTLIGVAELVVVAFSVTRWALA